MPAWALTLLVSAQAVQGEGRLVQRGLAMGESHVCVADEGRVACAGANERHQLGDGYTGYSHVPIAGPAAIGDRGARSPVVEVAVGLEAICARAADGHVACWGAGSATEASVEGIADAVALVAEGGDTCALRKSGRVACWASSDYDGRSYFRRVRPHAVPGVAGIVALLGTESARGRGGRVVRWELHPNKREPGRAWAPDVVPGPSPPPPPLPALPSPPLTVVGSGDHHCALLADGHVLCWSKHNRAGQVGDGTMTPRPEPVPVQGLDDAVELAAFGYRTCARRRTGAVACWGENRAGEIGSPVLGNHPAPVRVEGIDDATALALGPSDSCALRRGGGFSCWGWGETGQLGDPALLPGAPSAPVRVVGAARAIEVVAGAFHTCARDGAGGVRCWGRRLPRGPGDCQPTPAGIACPPVSNGSGTSCGGRPWGRPELWGVPQRITDLAPALAIDARSDRTCAVLAQGRITCFVGDEACCGEGRGKLEDVAVVPDATAIALGGGHTCVLTRAGRIGCWGRNGDGQLGDGTRADRAAPAAVAGVAEAVMLALGERHSCALLRDGRATCFGLNVTGQLGDGTADPAPGPVMVAGLRDAVELRAGYWHTCARTRDGAVYCWGENDSGALGDGTTVDRVAPARVVGLPPAVSLAAFGNATCARVDTGAVFCWGELAGMANQPRPIRRFQVD
jgi:alpha-tubulin suppressor-like RCC1 family protein